MSNRITGAIAGAITGMLGVTRVSAQDDLDPDIAAAGNGGVAVATANGGAVVIGDVNSGGNAGNAIGIGDTHGAVAVDGGTVTSATDIFVSADGGVAIADASGGDYNFAFVS